MIEVVAALIWQGEKFMICQRPPHKARGMLWEFVGGKVDPGENAEEALLRELREEMALKAHIVRPYDAVLHTYPDFTIHLQTFLCEMDSDYVILEHEEAFWLSIDTLDTTDWAPADAPIVEKIKREFGKE